MISKSSDGLHVLLPTLAEWFRRNVGTPTPPQRRAWPVIAEGRHTLVLAPTGSGKTLSAFLACLDHLWRHPASAPGVRVLYLSPLKALNQDIARNLEGPLQGILKTAEGLGAPLPTLRLAVRTGDTPAADRQRIVRKPPEILITTPESLHLMLTSKARQVLRGVSHVIVDEIHALCSNKRGVFLSLLLERLEAINTQPEGFLRIGLSATQRPLETVARFLGGWTQDPVQGRFVPRPVTIIDTGQRKQLDLQVTFPSPPRYPGQPFPGSIWPAIEQHIHQWINEHRSTIVFANNRRVVERLTARLNDMADDSCRMADQHQSSVLSHQSSVLSPQPSAIPQAPQWIKAHHGSISLERRRETESALKQGELRAVVATASLELGIDMGAVDLVCQVESPGGIARGLQRVGRAGHVVGQASKGRLLAKTPGDLLESAALARGMSLGEVEALRVPTNCLDILAQQVVACVAVDRWDVSELFQLIRRADPYQNLSAEAFETVLEMVSGRLGGDVEAFRDLRPRIVWDRVHNRLHPLPGTAQQAIVNGGAIPDTGQFPLYLGDGGPRLGELDEEFVLERRVGETFVLGSSTWKIEAIEPHRVLVSSAEGRAALMPFWRGEAASRTPELGEQVGRLCRELKGRLDDPEVCNWLVSEYHLDPTSARTLLDHVARQVRSAGAVPDDQTVLVETFRDPAGELALAILTPFGGRLHQALKLVLQGRLRERLGIEVASLHADDGLLIRLPDQEEPPLDLFEGLSVDQAERLLRQELGESALFGLRFRQNAGRALLMPRPDPNRRTPLWLQRLRARDLLQVARKVPDFPIVVETYRECLDDDLDLPRLRRFLQQIEAGEIRVVTLQRETPSPFASELIQPFTTKFLYEWDEPKRSDNVDRSAEAAGGLLDGLLASSLDPSAMERVESRLRGQGHPPRTLDEMAEWLERLGDLTPSELSGPMLGFLEDLQSQGRAAQIELSNTTEPARWINCEDVPKYIDAFHPTPNSHFLSTILLRFLRTRALVGPNDLTARYPIDRVEAAELLEHWEEQGALIRLESGRWGDRRNLEEVRRLSIALKRRESLAVAPELFADFVASRQRVHPDTQLEGKAALERVFELLQGYPAPATLWESALLPSRLKGYRPAWLDDLLSGGGWTWRALGTGSSEPRIAFIPRDFAGTWPPPEGEPKLSEDEAALYQHLAQQGATFAADLVAKGTGLEPSRTRRALEGLLNQGMVTNDRFDPVRPGGKALLEALEAATMVSTRRSLRGLGRPRPRRLLSERSEGRWAICQETEVDPEASLLAWASVLIDRYGVLTRETVNLDPWAPPWREFYPLLDRAELRGELRRGYFVEGLSGVQYAPAEVVEELSRLGEASEAKPLKLSTLDPANLYGSGAPLDIPLLQGGTARLTRTSSNSLILIAGRPILIVEGNGRRLTGLASASEAELGAALSLLPTLAAHGRPLKIQTYNDQPAWKSAIAPRLAELGFVREPPGMTFYVGY